VCQKSQFLDIFLILRRAAPTVKTVPGQQRENDPNEFCRRVHNMIFSRIPCIVSFDLWMKEVMQEIGQNKQDVPHIRSTHSGRGFPIIQDVLEHSTTPFCERDKTVMYCR
jgi:hypothetical protein